MKHSKTPLVQFSSLLSALFAGLGLMLAGRATAQTFTNLHDFNIGSDGGDVYAGLVLSSNTLYGTAKQGGSSSAGTVFKVNTDGTGFGVVHAFAGVPGSFSQTNADGAYPDAELVLSAGTLYGTAEVGGVSGKGVVFSVNTDGTGFVNLYSFTGGNDGANPVAGLILAGGMLYGTAANGGSSDGGTIFAISANGLGFTNLYSFTSPQGSSPYTNSDGYGPTAGLVLSGSILYGTAYDGGTSGYGTVFAINTNGTGFTNLHNFTSTKEDGAFPYAGLVISGSTLYGTALTGGRFGFGAVFAINTDGTGYTNLHSFTTTSGSDLANGEGAYPYGGLSLSGSTLYGTAYDGGISGEGTVFAINTSGASFTNLYSFTATAGSFYPYTNGDGANPYAAVVVSGSTLYGTALDGGSLGYGTVFSLALGSVSAPQLAISRSGASIILTWPASFTGFTLQSATNLVSANWSAVSPPPVTINGQNTVTNAVTGKGMFYRLFQ